MPPYWLPAGWLPALSCGTGLARPDQSGGTLHFSAREAPPPAHPSVSLTCFHGFISLPSMPEFGRSISPLLGALVPVRTLLLFESCCLFGARASPDEVVIGSCALCSESEAANQFVSSGEYWHSFDSLEAPLCGNLASASGHWLENFVTSTLRPHLGLRLASNDGHRSTV